MSTCVPLTSQSPAFLSPSSIPGLAPALLGTQLLCLPPPTAAQPPAVYSIWSPPPTDLCTVLIAVPSLLLSPPYQGPPRKPSPPYLILRGSHKLGRHTGRGGIAYHVNSTGRVLGVRECRPKPSPTPKPAHSHKTLLQKGEAHPALDSSACTAPGCPHSSQPIGL